MHKNPERVAWSVLLGAFLTFCLLATGVPLGLRSYVLNAMVEQETQMQVIEGTVLVRKPNGGEPIGVTQLAALSPDDEVITDDTSWATLDLFDRSHVILYSNTDVELVQTYARRFASSDRPNRITLNVTGGLVRVGVALPRERKTDFRIVTPHSVILLEEGSYRIEVNNQGTEVTVDRGQAVVGGEALRIGLTQGTRTVVGLDGLPSEPMSAAQNLIENGSFQGILGTAWLTSTEVLDPAVQRPAIDVVEEGGRRAVHLVQRAAQDGDHTEAWVVQRLDRDVRDFVRLEVSLDVRLELQSLAGGGLLSSEFPVMVKLDYKDRWGNDKFWLHGFYYQNQAGYPVASDWWNEPRGEQIPQGVWFPYESGNLLDLLGDNKPAHITGLSIYASGWNYEGFVSEVQLIVE